MIINFEIYKKGLLVKKQYANTAFIRAKNHLRQNARSLKAFQ